MEPVKFIDIHAHAYRIPVPFVVQFPSPAELIARYDRENIETGFVLPIVSPEIYSPQTNEEVLEMAEKYPGRILPFCNVDPRMLTNSWDAPLDQVLSYYKERGCRGVGEIMPNMAVDDPMVQNLFKHCEKLGLPVTFDGSDRCHNDFGLMDDPGIPRFEHTLQRFPDLIFFAHGPIFWSELGVFDDTVGQRKSTFRPDGRYIGAPRRQGPVLREGAAVKLFRRYPNLLGELSDAASVLRADPDYGSAFLDEFQDRLFFGSDICFAEMPFAAKQLLDDWLAEKRISETIYRKIARENAVKFFNLPQ